MGSTHTISAFDVLHIAFCTLTTVMMLYFHGTLYELYWIFGFGSSILPGQDGSDSHVSSVSTDDFYSRAFSVQQMVLLTRAQRSIGVLY
jgi:hypothetical protein